MEIPVIRINQKFDLEFMCHKRHIRQVEQIIVDNELKANVVLSPRDKGIYHVVLYGMTFRGVMILLKLFKDDGIKSY